MSQYTGVLKHYDHPSNGRQLDLILEDGEAIQINCGTGIQVYLLGKYQTVRIELNFMTGLYYGITKDEFHISNLGGKRARY